MESIAETKRQNKWIYEFWKVNGCNLVTRKNLRTNDCQVQVTEELAKAMGYDSINEMFRPRPEWNNILECIYGDYNKWLEIHWISIVNGEITMVLKLSDPRTIMVTSERRQ